MFLPNVQSYGEYNKLWSNLKIPQNWDDPYFEWFEFSIYWPHCGVPFL